MKKAIFLISLLICAVLNAQIVNIPDANFKAKLVSSSTTSSCAYNANNALIKVDANDDGEIQVSEANQVFTLWLPSSNIANLTGVGMFVNLKYLNCNSNQLTSLDVSQNTNLIDLYCNYNQLTNLDVSQNLNLSILRCGNNQLTSLDVSQNANLTELRCEINQISNLVLGNNASLINLYCYNNQIANLDVRQCLNLTTLDCNRNLLANLDLLQNVNLKNFYCGNNQLANLDLRQNVNLMNLYCPNNQLVNIFTKNNNSSWALLDFSNNPNLRYICADDDDLTLIRQKITQYGYIDCHANSYCSFTPGGTYNTITGLVKYDYQNDGCTISDMSTKYLNVKINDGTNSGYTCIDSNDKYNFFTQTGTFTVSPQLEIPSYFNVSPVSATQTFVNSNNNIATHNFCLTAIGVQPDVEVVVAPIVPARPGFEATYRLAYKNKGNQIITNGQVTLSYDSTRMTFLNASLAPVSVVPGLLTFDYSNFEPFENDAITIDFLINSPVQMPAVNIGDVLPLNATITSSNGDVLSADNTFQFNQVVVGAYDPNEVTCLQGNDVSSSLIGDYLHYLVRFENMGNHPATNIVVESFVDSSQYQLETMQIINATHNLYSRTTGNRVEFIFEDIQLAAAAGPGGGGGHGGILLKMRSSRNLVPGNKVSRKANIYFDYNAPIVTNDEETIFSQLSLNTNLSPSEYTIKPNPVADNLVITVNSGLEKVELYDVNGRLLQTHFDQANETKIDMNRYANGVYYVKVYTSKGIGIQKVIKE